MAQIYDIAEHEIMFKDNVARAVMRNLKSQGAPIGDDLELEKGWKMTWEYDINNGTTRYRIFNLECE